MLTEREGEMASAGTRARGNGGNAGFLAGRIGDLDINWTVTLAGRAAVFLTLFYLYNLMNIDRVKV
jgi:hypothetical protein